jgi:hypothetical protein
MKRRLFCKFDFVWNDPIDLPQRGMLIGNYWKGKEK